MEDISEYLKQEIDVVKLYKCEDHFYHIECLNNLIKDKQGGGFKCAMCQKIYGILEGSMPPGTMKVYISKSPKYKYCKLLFITYVSTLSIFSCSEGL